VEIKTLFVITLSTARVFFPGIPMTTENGPPPRPAEVSPAVKTITFDVLSDQKTDKNSTATCAVPEGLKLGKTLTLQIDPRYLEDKEAKPVESTKGVPTVKCLAYWGCAEKIADGQPMVMDPKANVETKSEAKPDDKPEVRNNPIQLPSKSYAYWPWGLAPDIADDASAPGVYTLTTSFAGGTEVMLDKDQDFMQGLTIANVDKQHDPNKPIEIRWNSIKGARAYFVSAVGGSDEASITWNCSAKPNAPTDLESRAIEKDELEKLIKDGVVLSPETTKCVIPAGVFAKANSAVVNLIAIGADKIQEKDGIVTHVVVRSSAGIPILTAPYVEPPPPAPEAK